MDSSGKSEINDLARRFLDLVARHHYGNADRIREWINHTGVLTLNVDGTCEAGTDVLFGLIDGTTQWVLVSDRIASENTADITTILQYSRHLFGSPRATVHDLSEQIKTALAAVFPESHDLICHYHFLKVVGEKLLQHHHAALTAKLRAMKIMAPLRSLRADLVRADKKEFGVTDWTTDSGNAVDCFTDDQNLSHSKRTIVHSLLKWVSDSGADLNGEYFPFDLPNLAQYRRLLCLAAELQAFSVPRKKWLVFNTAKDHLMRVKHDQELTMLVDRLEKAVVVFDALRDALSFAPQHRSLIRQHPPVCSTEIAQNVDHKLRVLKNKMTLIRDTEQDPDVRAISELSDYHTNQPRDEEQRKSVKTAKLIPTSGFLPFFIMVCFGLFICLSGNRCAVKVTFFHIHHLRRPCDSIRAEIPRIKTGYISP